MQADARKNYDRLLAAAREIGPRWGWRVDVRLAMPTTMEDFVKDTLRPLIEKARTDGVKPETFLTWCSQRLY
ncbi:hypothetical protein [Brucella oryzae]|uniref:hypothetical protein n=1 Tax=Brucella oryzae TaxID=335286 RepID=UPI001FE09385|nr:hypothetical protein [Brucella oryzae]